MPIVPPVDPTDPPIAVTPPEQAVGGAIDQLPPTNPILGAIVLLPTREAIRDALQQLAGTGYPSLTTALMNNAQAIQNAMSNRMDDAFSGGVATYQEVEGEGDQAPVDDVPNPNRFGKNLTIWADSYGSRTKQKGEFTDIVTNVTDSVGITIGADTRVLDNIIVGIMGGYSQTDSASRNSGVTSDNWTLGREHWAAHSVTWILKAGGAYTWNDNQASRLVSIPRYTDTFHADYQADNHASNSAASGDKFPIGQWSFEPYADAAWINVKMEPFEENGGPASSRTSKPRMPTRGSPHSVCVPTTNSTYSG